MEIKIERKPVTVDKFVVEGEMFDTEKEAKDFVKELESSVNKEYFLVNVKPDLTEGRGFYQQLIISVPKYTTVNAVYQYLLETYGNPISMVQGAAPMATYALSERKKFGNYAELKSFLNEERYVGIGSTKREKSPIIHLNESGKEIATKKEE